MANESRIELRGISNLVSFLTVKGSCLLPDIKQNDKTPSWDGFIEVYQNDKHSKEGLRKIPTQVKSTTSTNIKDNEVKKSFSRIDLENYFHDGGILIFFIVDVDNESKIFFRFFQKVDLNNILVSMRNKQKEKTLSFQKLDSDIKKFEISCRNFLLHKKNQFSFDVFNTKPDNIELVIQEISQGTYEFLNSLYESAKNIYWRSSPETKIPDNVFKGIIKPTINELKNELIQIGDSEFTYNVKILTYVNKIEIYFGNSIHITYPKINIKIDDDCQDNENEANILPKPSISYQLTNKIDEIKKDLEFLTSFFKHQKIVLRNSTLLQVKNHDKTFDETYKALKEDLIRLNQIITLLDIFHIKHEKLLLNKIKSENDFRNLHFLINHIVLKKSLTSEKASPKLKYQICFGGINLLVTIDGGNNVYKVMNFCDIDTLKISTVDKPSESYICSQYVFLTHQEIIDNDNINLDIMVKSIKSFEKNEEYITRINLTILELIKAFDKTKENDYLTSALDLLNWLKEEIEDDILLVNIMQIFKRQRKLSNMEIDQLKNIKSENSSILCCVDILLDDKNSFEKHFSSLNMSDKKVFKEFPIYTLYKNIS